ncbi:hypothetical protein LCGC14_0364820 [marine sediment metagenome]|uniref:Uncharacterized protein n=1 Tax=marine sediment metagenome TaxID=412755 RepID=A0A0F9T6Z3_9ZZZZ
MALQTIQQRVMDQLGDTIGGVMAFTALWVKDQVNLGIRVIINRTPTKKCKHLYGTAPAKFAPTSGLLVETKKIISVLRDDDGSIPRECMEVPYENSAEVNDVNSQYAPSENIPKFVMEPQTDGTMKIKVYPVSGSSIATANYVKYIEVDPSSAVTLAGFPEELEPFVDLYVVIQGKIRSLGYYRKLINDVVANITGSVVIGTTTFTSQTSVSVTHNAGVKPIVQILDANDVLIEGTVTHNTVNDFTVTFLFSQTGTIITSVGSSSGGDLVSFINSLPTWNDISMGTMPTVPTLEADASSPASALPTPPTIVSDISAFIAANALPTAPTIVSDISSFIAANALPTTPSIEADASEIVALLGAIPTYDGSTTNTLTDIVVTRIESMLNTAADMIWKEQDGTDDISNDVENFLSTNDSEMANVASSGANAAVNTAQAELAKELAKLRNWEGEYKSKVQNFAEQIDAWLGRWKTYTDEDNIKIKKFLGDLDSWIKHWKSFVDEDTVAISKYGVDLKAWDMEWNAYNDEDKIALEKYLADLNVWATQWKSFVDEDSLKISIYKEEVTEVIVTYRADIENEAQRFALGIQKSRSHLESAKVRSGIVTGYLQSVGLIPNEITELQKRFDIGVESYVRN